MSDSPKNAVTDQQRWPIWVWIAAVLVVGAVLVAAVAAVTSGA